jgi:hypothetical protein
MFITTSYILYEFNVHVKQEVRRLNRKILVQVTGETSL